MAVRQGTGRSGYHMELQEVGRYEVEPFALERILELHLTKKVNEHARLSIRGVLKEGG